MLLHLTLLYLYLTHDTVWHPITNKIILPLKIYKNDCCNFEFLSSLSHELTHSFRLPNHSLLADAYAGLMLYEMVPNEWNDFTKNETDEIVSFTLVDEALTDASNLATKEATIRKILSNKKLRQKLENCFNKEEVKQLFYTTSKGLVEKDYKIPRIKFDAFSGWVYTYGTTMAYFAIQNFTDTPSAMQFIYKLGQIRDSKELADFNSNSVNDSQSSLISIHTVRKSVLLKKFNDFKSSLIRLKTGL